MKRAFYKEDTNAIRESIRQFYINKFYNLFMSGYSWTGLEPQEIDYIMRRFWADGRVAAAITKVGNVIITNKDHPNGQLVFAKYIPSEWNTYDFATKVTLVNNRGLNVLPKGDLIVNKDVVLGFIQKNKKGILESIEQKINEIVDVEMVIRLNLKAHKTPYLLEIDNETQERVNQIWNSLESDNPKVAIHSEEIDAIKVLTTGAPYIIDKLKAYEKELIDEVTTFLGMDCLGIQEKPEQLRVDEINSNNDVINDHAGAFITCLEDFAKEVTEYLGIAISVKATSKPVTATSKEDVEEDEKETEL